MPTNDKGSNGGGATQTDESFRLNVPQISLPKGGGAIRGMGEKFGVNPVTGTGSMSVPLATSPGRSGFGPRLSLSYDSASGNGPFGFGWALSIPAITRKTDKGLPRYRDAEESDVYLLSGAEDLVPVLEPDGKRFVDPTSISGFTIHRYRPRIEGLFARIERWTDRTTGEIHWRSITRDNVTSVYGRGTNSCVFDPSDPSPAHPMHVFSWLISESYDDKGNAIVYEYAAENETGVDRAQANERNRTRTANRYLKRVKYGNATPYRPGEDLAGRTDWLFELVLDYGEHYTQDDQGQPTAVLLDEKKRPWDIRPDPFSSYRAGFEVRTYRLCRRALMFHHFRTELGTPDCVVRATEFEYQRNRIASFMVAVSQAGFLRRPDGSYLKRSLPPVEFEYSQAEVKSEIQEIDPVSLENLPYGIDGSHYQWLDLDGEGVSGILSEQGDAWYYKPNLGEGQFGPVKVVARKPSTANLRSGRQQLLDLAGDGQLDLVTLEAPTPGFFERTAAEDWEPFHEFRSLPNLAWSDPNLRFVDLTGDGHADVLVTGDGAFIWHESLGEEGFGAAESACRALDEEKGPRLVFADGTQSIYLADMSGDGLTDLVRLRNGEVCYWPNLGYGRFGGKVTMDNAPWFDHPDQFDQKRIRLADIDGSGVVDIIYLAADGPRLYFNQAGNCWDDPEKLASFPQCDNVKAVAATDLLGKGTACLVWSSPLVGDARSPMRYVDLMGQKPHLLVKIRNNLGATTEIQYAPSTKFYLADKAAGTPWVTKLPFPVHVVEKVTTADAWRGTSFSTTYSYHHGCFDGIEREFRGFGRFEQVDRQSYGEFQAGNAASIYITTDKALYQPPVKIITWVHTGAALDDRRILSQFQNEYFPTSLAALPSTAAVLAVGFKENPLPEPDLGSQDLSADEWREALRACKGITLRQEIYELDVNALEPSSGEPSRQIPVRLFSAATHSCCIRRLQPKLENRHAVFLVMESEALSYHYELDLRPVTLPKDASNTTPLFPDPRVAQTLNLLFDEYGNIQQSVAVAYPRAGTHQDERLSEKQLDLIHAVQNERHVAYTETHYTGDAIVPPTGSANDQQHRLRLPCEVLTFELTGIAPPSGKVYLDLAFLRSYRLSETLPEQGSIFVGKLEYHERPDGIGRQKRKVEHTRTLWFRDDPADASFLRKPLALGEQGRLGLPYEHYKLALTAELLNAMFSGSQLNAAVPLESAAPETIIDKLNDPTISGYLNGTHATDKFGPSAAGEYWMRSGVAGFSDDAAQHFYQPDRYTDAFGSTTTLAYDGKYDLFIQSSTDALDNAASVELFDYRVLAPSRMKDVNDNESEVYFDALGMVVAAAVKGKGSQADNLVGYDEALANPTAAVLKPFFSGGTFNEAEAARLLGNATMRHLYHFGEAVDNDGKSTWGDRPAGACAILREKHVAELTAGSERKLQVSFECSDGLGSVLMKKLRAEAAPDKVELRWIVTGKTVFNNKGKAVKQYEPYFSDQGHGCEEPKEVGVTLIMFYDAAGRLVRTEMPDGSFSRVEFSPWFVASYDANDTVLERGNAWYARATSGSPEQRRAAELAAVHAGTPALTYLDSLGRDVISVAHNSVRVGDTRTEERYLTYTKLDAEGKPLWIRDTRGNLVMQYIRPSVPSDQASDPVSGFVPGYDIAGNLLCQHSMDAGDRWMINDAAGKAMFAWDNRDNLFSSSYDALHRPTRLELKNLDHPGWIVVGLSQYGEGATDDKKNNLRGRPYRTLDQSGMVTNEEFDFKGNARRVSRRLGSDFAVDADWRTFQTSPLDHEPNNVLMTETFTQRTEYDALNRITRQHNWSREGKPEAVYEPSYNARGLLVCEDLTVGASRTAAAPADGIKTRAIQDIRYNAKGQRIAVSYGNGVTTQYTYDAVTFRLLTLVSTRPSKPDLQNLRYTYDPSGNITETFDDAVPTEFFNGAIIEPRKRYTNDALYRLIEATGREHKGQLNNSTLDNWNDFRFRVDYGANNYRAWRNYTQRYTYDGVGNILVVQHIAQADTANSWTRQYQYATNSNRLIATGLGSTRVDHYPLGGPTLEYRYTYNAHGSMETLPHLPTMDWNYTEHLQHVSRAPASQSNDPDGCPDSSLEAWYRYDAVKQRTFKRVEKQGGLVEDRFYLSGLEWYRRTLNGTLKEEIETLHMFDGQRRLLVVDQVLKTNRAGLGAGNLYRYTLSSHGGSAIVEVDENGDVVSFEEYHPYGTTAYQSGRSTAEVRLKRYRYTGMERDEESGFGYHGARYFSGSLARWLTPDPSGMADGVNSFRYARNNPVFNIDTDGHQTVGTMQSLADVARRDLNEKMRLLSAMTHHPEQFSTVREETRGALRAEISALDRTAGAWEARAETTADFHKNVGLPTVAGAAVLAGGAPAVAAGAGGVSLLGVLAGGTVLGGGLGAGRQLAEMADGTRSSFSLLDVIGSAGQGGAWAPAAVAYSPVRYGMFLLGVTSGGSELLKGHTYTGLFDMGTAVVPEVVTRANASRMSLTDLKARLDPRNYAIDATSSAGMSGGGSIAFKPQQTGGAYKDVPSAGGEVNHIPAFKAVEDAGIPLSRGDAPGIRMDRGDHRMTANWGTWGYATITRALEKILIKEGDFATAQDAGIAEVRALFGTKYDVAIKQMLDYSVAVGLRRK